MTKNNTSKSKKNFDKAKIKREKGLNVSYDKQELKTILPHLMEELSEGKKSIKIDSVEYNVEKSEEAEKKNKECIGEDLSNPKTIDFIRRCRTKKEAYEILEYLLKRNEISEKEYKDFEGIIKNESDLQKLIKDSGGFKRPGYYMRKYYYNQENNKKTES